VQFLTLAGAIGLFAVIAYGDLRKRRIPNTLALGVAILGLTRILLAHDPAAASEALAAASITFAGMFLLFCGGMIGGGDAKLVAATALLVGPHELPRFLLSMSVCGGLLGLAMLLQDQVRTRKILGTASVNHIAGSTDTTVPYGVAVAAAGVISLVLEAPLAR